jgi:hypothetical protein
MLDALTFKAEILEPVLTEFREQPHSLHKGFCAIWSLDSYASHCAFQCHDVQKLSRSQRGIIEEKFKNRLQDSHHDDAWKFRLIRQASNATKHALRKNMDEDVPNSKGVVSEPVEGFAWYFSGASHWGNQVVIDVSWIFDEESRSWFDGKGQEVNPGPFFKWVPLLDIIDPCKEHIERGLETETVGREG